MQNRLILAYNLYHSCCKTCLKTINSVKNDQVWLLYSSFCDDIVFVAKSDTELQRLLDLTHEYVAMKKLRLNADKSAIVVIEK